MPKLKQDMRAILTTNWKIWIPFQFLNFNFVPQQLQVRPQSAQEQQALLLKHPASLSPPQPGEQWQRMVILQFCQTLARHALGVNRLLPLVLVN